MNKPPRLACNYAILRFMPYFETGEFVNIGVVLACPDLQWADYKIESAQRERVMDFFPEIKKNNSVFIEGRKLFKEELARVRSLLGGGDGNELFIKETAKDSHQIFRDLVRPRQETFCFSPLRTCLTNDPASELEKLFEFYVRRNFAQHVEYQERIMTKRLKTVFSTERIVGLEEYTFSNEFCSVTFPFVRKSGEQYERAIHPLDLGKNETTHIVERADKWRARLSRLNKAGERPNQVLLVVHKPLFGRRLDVCNEVCREICDETNALILPKEDETGIINFARAG